MACRWWIQCWCARRNAWARARPRSSGEVYFPASLPHIFTGLTVGMGVAWGVAVIAAEMISGQYGIGYFTWEAYSLVQYPDIALGMICIGVLGLGSSALIRGLGRVVMRGIEHERTQSKRTLEGPRRRPELCVELSNARRSGRSGL